MAGEVLSTLYQCMKFEWGCQDIVIHGEWSQSVYLEHAVLFIEGLDGVDFHVVEILQTMKIEKIEHNLGMQSPYRSKMHPDKNYIDPIEIEVWGQHAYCFHVDEDLDGKPWYYEIKRFLQTRDYPENATNGQK
ncbi:uncharacterized protein LOC142167243 [Nicotiana tabacum]|uniref:Uncharacterized protein LOC142167243 n=1 Tax=Nicotiana tabacum TaxID=4097 RepID=A0AC58SET9_TOBAC